LIVAFEGKPVAGIDDLHRLLTDAQVGVRSKLAVIRYSDKVFLDIVPIEIAEN
jgi:hypothetical protein